MTKNTKLITKNAKLTTTNTKIIEDAYGESPPPPGIHHFVARPADIKQDFAGVCRNLHNFGTFQQDLSKID